MERDAAASKRPASKRPKKESPRPPKETPRLKGAKGEKKKKSTKSLDLTPALDTERSAQAPAAAEPPGQANGLECIDELHAALGAAPAVQADGDLKLLERLTALMGPLAEAARIEKEQEAAERALGAAHALLAGPSASLAASSGSSLFSQLAGRGPRLPSSAAATRQRLMPMLTRNESGLLRGFLETAHAEIDALLTQDTLLRARLVRVRELVPPEICGAELTKLLGEMPRPIPSPPSLVQAKSKMGVTSTLLKWNAGETDASLRRREMKGDGLDLPDDDAVDARWKGEAYSHQRAAADVIFGARAQRPVGARLSTSWKKTLELAQKRAGVTRVADPDEAVRPTPNFAPPPMPRPLRLSPGKSGASPGKRAKRRWAKVAALALAGRWSPRPDDVASPAAHVGKGANGFPSLADPFGLLDEEEEEEDDGEDDDDDDDDDDEDPYSRGQFTVAVEDDDDEEAEAGAEAAASAAGAPAADEAE